MRVLSSAAGALFFWGVAGSAPAGVIDPFISEIHYDNAGGDVGEFVAVTAPGGTDLAGWQLVLYNGATGDAYGTLALDGTVPATAGWGEVDRAAAGLQNGDDAVALLSPDRRVVDFIAYEGSFDAIGGLAAGHRPRLLPVEQGGSTPPGTSLQRTGSLDDWLWLPLAATPGSLNAGLLPPPGDAQGVALPSVPTAWIAGLLAWGLYRRYRSATREGAAGVCVT